MTNMKITSESLESMLRSDRAEIQYDAVIRPKKKTFPSRTNCNSKYE
jgi:hypothetical protein